jgi:hypothetical protein
LDKLELLTDVLCLTETSKVRKKFEETTKELENLEHDDDESTKKIVKFLVERNKKLIDCLDYVKDQLPKLLVVKGGEDKKFFEMTKAMEAVKDPIKLFITNKQFSNVKTVDDHLEFLGTVEVGGRENPDSLKGDSLNGKVFSGFIESSDGNIEEVLLIYKTKAENETNDELEDTIKRVQFEGGGKLRELSVIKVDLLPAEKLGSAGRTNRPESQDEPGKTVINSQTWVKEPNPKQIKVAANQNIRQNSNKVRQPIEVSLKDFKQLCETSQDLQGSNDQLSSNQSEFIPKQDPIHRNFFLDLR